MIGFGFGFGFSPLGALLNQIPAANLATMWLDGSIVDVSGSKYFVNKKGDNVLITGYDFPSGWVKGFPYKSAATIDVFGQTGVPVVSLFQNFDYANQFFTKHVAQVVDVNGVETSEAYVSEIVAYSAPLTGDDLTDAVTYYEVPTESATAKWVSPAGNDTTGDGSKATPYATNTKIESLTAAIPGYTKSGTYVENGSLACLYLTKARDWKALGKVEIKQTSYTTAVYLTNAVAVLLEGYIFNAEGVANSYRGFSSATLKVLKRCLLKNAATNEADLRATCDILDSIFISSCANSIRLFGATNINSNLFKSTNSTAVITDSSPAAGDINIINNRIRSVKAILLTANVANKVTVKGNDIIVTSAGAAISIQNKSEANIVSNKITVNAEGCISVLRALAGTSITLIQYNLISNISASGKNISVGGETTSAYDDTITSSIIGNKSLCVGYFTPATTGHTIHGIFCGFQKDSVIKYNFSAGSAIGLLKKHSTVSDTTGFIGYNVSVNDLNSIYSKGQSGTKIINNTIINTLNVDMNGIRLSENTGGDHASNCIVKNNILIYTGTGKFTAQRVSAGTGNEIDYNIYYCPDGTLVFDANGVDKTFAEWQALGYDTHSIVLTEAQFDALFVNFAGGNYALASASAAIGAGVALDAAYDDGLDASTAWGDDITLPVIVTKQQAAAWDCGAYVH